MKTELDLSNLNLKQQPNKTVTSKLTNNPNNGQVSYF